MLEALVRRLETDKMNGGVSPMLKYSYAPDTLQHAVSPPSVPPHCETPPSDSMKKTSPNTGWPAKQLHYMAPL